MKSLEFLQYDSLYIALFFQVNTTFSAFKRVLLIFYRWKAAAEWNIPL